MAGEYIFTMRDLRKVVPPSREILKGIYLSFFPGAKIGVLGANGAGKSSLLRIMAGIDKDFLGDARPLPGTRIVLTGGVFGHPSERLADAAMAELPGGVAVRHPPPPIAGVLLLALDRLGVTVDAGVVAAGLPLPVPDERSARWAGSPSRA